MNTRLDPRASALSAATVAAGLMLLLGVLGNLGFYTGAAEMMMGWHEFFSLSAAGIAGGMIEAFVITFVVVFALAVIYDRLLPSPSRRLRTSTHEEVGAVR